MPAPSDHPLRARWGASVEFPCPGWGDVVMWTSQYKSLARPIWTTGTGTVDAVFVCVTWDADGVREAASVAAALECPLVALCSGAVDRLAVATVCGDHAGLVWLVIELPSGFRHRLLDFATSQVQEAAPTRLGDLSVKRNLALLLARSMSWRRVLFLDEDIRDVCPAEIRVAARALEKQADLDVVGFDVDDFPDNSVVCHANRLSGQCQGTFLSGAALLVDAGGIESFFPTIYNEDWLFMAGALSARRIGRVGAVSQLPYEPFSDPDRAEQEEFGDVIAEGVMHHSARTRGGSVNDDRDYWRTVLDRRRRFIETIVERLSVDDHQASVAALAALRAAERRRAEIDPAACASFVRRWQRDLASWRERLHSVRRDESLNAVLSDLHVREHAQSSWRL